MKKLTLLIITLALFTLAFADIYTIGTGTSTSGLCPFYGYYDYSWSKAIWTAAELTTAGVPANTPITGIGFYVGNTPSNYTMLDQRIYVRTTTLTSYGTAQDETGTGYPNPAYFLPLFQGNLTYNGGGWHYIMFTTPATWDGTSNLELLFENWDGEYVSGYPTFRYTSTSPNYMMVYKYQDDSFPADAGNSSYNRPNVAIITPSTTPPEAPVLSLPLDGATGVSITPTLSWTAPTSGAVPTGYKVYLGVSTPLTTPFAETTTLSYTVPSANALQYNTTYFWTVSAYNENGEGPQADPVRSFTTREDPTIYTFPWLEDFGTTGAAFPPPDWSKLRYQFGGTPATGGSWGQDDWLNISSSGNKAARINIFSNTHYDWLVTPPIQISAAGYELKFDLALMKYGTQSTPVVPGAQADDRFLVVISNYPDMSSPTILMEWNNTGSPNVYDNIPATGETYIIDLDSYVGTKYIGFYGESLIDTAGDNDLMVDNVMVRETPAVPIFSYSPTSLEFGTTNVNHPTAYQNVTVTNNGVGTLNIAVGDVSIVGTDAAMFSFDDSHLPAALSAGQSVIIPVCYNPTEIGNHTAILRIVYNSTNYDVSLSGNALSEYALNESFESTTFPPVGWANPGNWSRNTSYYKHGTASAYKYGSTYSQYILSTPKLTITPTSTLDFWAMCGSITGTLQVVYSEDRTTWTPVGDDITFAATYTWYHQVIDLSRLEGNNYYLGFRTGLQSASYYVDAVFGPEITQEAPGPVTLTSPADGATLVSITPTFSWTAPTTGGVPTGYKVYLGDSSDLTDADIIADVTVLSYTIPSSNPLQYNHSYYWTVAAYNATGDGPQAPVRSFTTMPDPTIYDFPYTQNFETWPPFGWDLTGGSHSFTQYTDTSGNHWAKANFYYQSSGSTDILTSPPIHPTRDLRMKFTWSHYYTSSFPNDALTVQISSDLSNWTNLWYKTGTDLNSNDGATSQAPGTGVIATINIPDSYNNTTFWIRFYAYSGYGYDLFIDNVVIEEIPAEPVLSLTPDSLDFGEVALGVSVGPQKVTVTNTGSGVLTLNKDDNTQIIGTGFEIDDFDFSLAANESGQINVYAHATQEGPFTATLKITYGSNEYEVSLSATGLPEGTIVIGTGHDDLSLPIEPWYGYSYSQSIFLQSDIHIANRYIDKISFYWYADDDATSSNNWTIYMANTDLTEFADENSWVTEGLTQVFSGTLDLSAGERWIEITLDPPFYHNNQNLIIAVDENTAGYDYDYYYDYYFYCTSTAAKGYRSIIYYNDSTNPDPANPPTNTFYNDAITGFPNLKLQFQEEQPPLPVELTTFTAVISSDNLVEISWITQSETGMVGYYIYRSTSETLDNAIAVSDMIEALNTAEQHTYKFIDSEIYDSGTYYYWLQTVEMGGTVSFHGPVSVYYTSAQDNPIPEIPKVTELRSIYPNPFNPVAYIPYSLAEESDAHFYIYNVKGQLLRHIYVGPKNPGYYQISWDGKDINGKACGSGVYYIIMKAGKQTFQRKAVLMK